MEPPPSIDACSGALSPKVDIMAAVEAERGGADGGRPDVLDEAEFGGSGGGAPNGGGATAVPERLSSSRGRSRLDMQVSTMTCFTWTKP